MTNKLCEELARVYHIAYFAHEWNEESDIGKALGLQAAQAIIDHLAPIIRDADYALRIAKRDIRNWYTSQEAVDATIEVIDKSLASLFAWQEKGK